jgi:hypothetical protein
MTKRAQQVWLFRQGDVLIEQVRRADIPAAARRQAPQGDRVVLAYGEVTGHAHAFAATAVTRYGASDDAFWLTVEQPGATLVHEEHTVAVVPAGVEALRFTRQQAWVDDAIVNSAD